MQTIILINNIKAPVPLRTVHGKQMHIVVLHTLQIDYTCRLLRMEEHPMKRFLHCETGIHKVEISTFGIILCIGIKSEKPRQANEEHKMEIRKTFLAGIKPHHRTGQIRKKSLIPTLFFQDTKKELRQERGRISASSSTIANGWNSKLMAPCFFEREADTRKDIRPFSRVKTWAIFFVSLYLNEHNTIPLYLCNISIQSYQ